MEKTAKELMRELFDTFRDSVCAQGLRNGDKNGNGGCGNPVALTLDEINDVLVSVELCHKTPNDNE